MNVHRYNTPVEKVADATIPARIDILLSNGLINDWEKNFLTSIKEGFQKYKSLTKGQYDTMLKVEQRYDGAAIAARDSWLAAWNHELATNWKTLTEYYSTTPYYGNAIRKAKDPKYIPTEAEYKSVCENKYAVKYINQHKVAAKYKRGQLVVYKEHGGYFLSTVVEVGMPASWAKGSRCYTINIVGEAELQNVAESELLFYRDSIVSKLATTGKAPPF